MSDRIPVCQLVQADLEFYFPQIKFKTKQKKNITIVYFDSCATALQEIQIRNLVAINFRFRIGKYELERMTFNDA